jgi:PAS domain S-box-containing protein
MKNIAESNSLLSVLCLEDELKDAELLKELLVDASYLVSMDIAKGEKEYVDFLKGSNYDIIISDNSLPGFDALAALKLALKLKPEIPFICVSGTIGEEKAVELLKHGASDYVLKDRMGRLAFAVQRALKEKEMQKERKQAEKALNDNEKKLRIVFNVMEEGMALNELVFDDEGEIIDYKILEVNSSYERITSLSREQVVGRNATEIYGLSSEYINSFWKQHIHDIHSVKTELYDKIYKIWTHISTSIPAQNKFSTIFSNITERKQAELELIKAKECAEESDRLKSAFLANMSHEIRTPMNGILGFAELMKEPNLKGEEQQEYIRIIEKSGARMLNIINDIIDISKIEAGLMKLDIQNSNINEQIEYIYTFFKPEVEAKEMKLSFKNTLPSKEAIINTDREKLFAILTNLVKNAIKYTNEGSIIFGYDIVETLHATSLRFYVKDTGIGIQKDRQKFIFERFVQADIADKMARQGAGLGLSITKAYVEMLGGKIWVESEEGKGSTFYFTLPYNTDPNEKIVIENTVSDDGAEQKNNPGVSGLKILIAEDDKVSEILFDITVKMLSKEILKARTGIEAVEICRNNPDIDLILMDIQMPDLDGYEATRQIRQFNKHIIIIAQTAYAFSGDREKAIEAGCNDYISKPINQILLKELIKKYCNKYYLYSPERKVSQKPIITTVIYWH